MDVGSKARIATATAQRLLSWIFFFLFLSSTLLLGLSTERGISWVFFFLLLLHVLEWIVGLVGSAGWVLFLFFSLRHLGDDHPPPPSKSWPALSAILPFF